MFSSGNINLTANTTEPATHAIWHMLQGFLGVFPQYNPGAEANSTAPATSGVNPFAESYGGKFRPKLVSLREKQNEGRRNGSLLADGTVEIKLSSLGIIDGCVNDLIQGRYCSIFAANSMYGIAALNQIEEQEVTAAFVRQGDCKDLIEKCRDSVRMYDSCSVGGSDLANRVCSHAQRVWNNSEAFEPCNSSGRDVYDVTQPSTDSFPPAYISE
jgi:carboxypeptidase C (cathepsin A)